jgi:8-amino-7-oxononanoate synthase
LLIDDAHGFGVLGAQGRGSLAHFGIASQRIICMATLGKAAGVFGAFVAAEQVVIDTLVNHARSYVYTTATPPALASALLESLQQITNGEELRGHLQRLIAQLRSGLRDLPWTLMSSTTAIQPILVGSNRAALKLSEGLRERGIWVAAIRPPTVPQGTARLRITLSAAHRATDVTRLIETLHELAR